MVQFLRLVIIGAVFAVTAQAELLLTPRLVEYASEGGKLTQLVFTDGDKTVTYQAPRGWECSGNSSQLTLHPPNKIQATATITRIVFSQPGSFDEESLKQLTTEAVALVPKGSESISILSQQKNPLMIQGKETFLVTLSYSFYGQKYGRSILYLNRGNEQLRSQLTCRENDFNALHRAFQASQFTWQNL